MFFPAISVSHKNMLISICKTASKIIGLPIQPVSRLTERAMARKANAVANDPAHPLNDTKFDLLPSQRRYLSPTYLTICCITFFTFFVSRYTNFAITVSGACFLPTSELWLHTFLFIPDASTHDSLMFHW